MVEILRRCHAARVPVVARGAGTSLSGGALPDKRGILLSMAKFRKILSIDPLARTAVVQPGVRNLGDLRGGGPVRPLLRAGPLLADRLHDRRQRRRERRRRALPQVRPHRPQRPARARRAHHRRDRRIRRRRAGQPRLRPAGAGDRFRGSARRHHRDHREAHAEAADGAGGARGVRRRGGGRRSGGRGDRGRHRAGGAGDDGPPGDPRRRGVRPRELPPRRRRGAAGRDRRHRRGSRRGHGRDHAGALRVRRDGDSRLEGRARAPAAVVGAQGGVPRDRPDHPRLLLHGRDDSAQGARPRAAADRGAVRNSTDCAARTCSTQATATCTR